MDANLVGPSRMNTAAQKGEALVKPHFGSPIGPGLSTVIALADPHFVPLRRVSLNILAD